MPSGNAGHNARCANLESPKNRTSARQTTKLEARVGILNHAFAMCKNANERRDCEAATSVFGNAERETRRASCIKER